MEVGTSSHSQDVDGPPEADYYSVRTAFVLIYIECAS